MPHIAHRPILQGETSERRVVPKHVIILDGSHLVGGIRSESTCGVMPVDCRGFLPVHLSIN